MAERLPNAVGGALRQARRDRGWTLRAVQARSSGRFKPSSLGGYERGEREISLSRFCDLAHLYGVSPPELLGRALGAIPWTTPVVIDLTRLNLIPEQEGRRVAEFVLDLRTRRGEPEADVIPLRAGDLEILATTSREEPKVLLEKLKPALIGPPD
jgi:transcriptional regulator with XRE-family HTH domain